MTFDAPAIARSTASRRNTSIAFDFSDSMSRRARCSSSRCCCRVCSRLPPLPVLREQLRRVVAVLPGERQRVLERLLAPLHRRRDGPERELAEHEEQGDEHHERPRHQPAVRRQQRTLLVRLLREGRRGGRDERGHDERGHDERGHDERPPHQNFPWIMNAMTIAKSATPSTSAAKISPAVCTRAAISGCRACASTTLLPMMPTPTHATP